jgi:hypothetical protein
MQHPPVDIQKFGMDFDQLVLALKGRGFSRAATRKRTAGL